MNKDTTDLPEKIDDMNDKMDRVIEILRTVPAAEMPGFFEKVTQELRRDA